MTNLASLPVVSRRVWLWIAWVAWLILLLLSVYVLVATTVIAPSFAAQLGWSRATYQAAAAGLGVPTIVLDSIHLLIASLTRLSYLAIGVLLFLRKRSETSALFVATFLVSFAVLGVYVGEVAQNHRLVSTPLNLVQAVGEASFVILAFTFPDGRWVPRWAAWPTTATVVILMLARFEPVRTLPLYMFLAWLAVIWMFAGAPALLYRYHKVADARQRQQIKWGVFGILSLILIQGGIWAIFGYSLPQVLPALRQQSSTTLGYEFVRRSAMNLSALILPVALGIAILRYRLYNIDVIIRRTLFYAAFTFTLGLAYFGSVVVLQNVFQALTGERQSPIATVISTLAIAALFTPLRRRIQSDIDRRFYRQKYDAERALASFSALARQEVDLEEISDWLLDVVRETVQPEKASLWLRPAPRARHPGGDLV